MSFGGPDGARAFLWEHGTMMNPNDLVEFDGVLVSAQDVDDAGRITGRLVDPSGRTLAFVATPIPDVDLAAARSSRE